MTGSVCMCVLRSKRPCSRSSQSPDSNGGHIRGDTRGGSTAPWPGLSRQFNQSSVFFCCFFFCLQHETPIKHRPELKKKKKCCKHKGSDAFLFP